MNIFYGAFTMSKIIKIQHRDKTPTVKEYTLLTVPTSFVKEFEGISHMHCSIDENGSLVYSPVRS